MHIPISRLSTDLLRNRDYQTVNPVLLPQFRSSHFRKKEGILEMVSKQRELIERMTDHLDQQTKARIVNERKSVREELNQLQVMPANQTISLRNLDFTSLERTRDRRRIESLLEIMNAQTTQNITAHQPKETSNNVII